MSESSSCRDQHGLEHEFSFVATTIFASSRVCTPELALKHYGGPYTLSTLVHAQPACFEKVSDR